MKIKIGGDLSEIDLFPDDVFLVSYPRSGNTWMRLLLSSYATGSEDAVRSYQESHHISTDVYRSTVESMAERERPRLIKTHSPYDSRLPRVIYIVRDARDVAVSYYFYCLKFSKEEISFSEYLVRFNSGQVDKFGTWSNHVNSWLDNGQKSDDFLLVKYEDLIQDSCSQLKRVVDFIWGSSDLNKINTAVKAVEFSSLQQSEKRMGWFPGENSEIAFFRSGKVGDWANHFSPDGLQGFMLFHGSALKRLGYLSPYESHQFETDKLAVVKQTADQTVVAGTTDIWDKQFQVSLQESHWQIQRQLRDIQEQLHQTRAQLGQFHSESAAVPGQTINQTDSPDKSFPCLQDELQHRNRSRDKDD